MKKTHVILNAPVFNACFVYCPIVMDSPYPNTNFLICFP